MWTYNYDYLSHSLVGRGQEWEDHKYIDKVKTKKGTYRYIYKESKTAKKNSKQAITGKGFGSSGLFDVYKRNSTTAEKLGLFVVDLKGVKQVKEGIKRVKNENKLAKQDSYDDVYSSKELAEGIKNYFYELYPLYGLNPEKAWKSDVKALRQFLMDYYATAPWDIGLLSDDEILCLYMQLTLESAGYDPDKMTLSHYLQNLGWINEKDIFKNSGVDSLDDLKKTSGPVDDDKDMEYVNHSNLDEFALTPYKKGEYPKEADAGYSANCAYCTLTYEIRQRGYDVEASAISWDTLNDSAEIGSWYIDPSTGKTCTPKTIGYTALSDYEDTVKKSLLKDVGSDGKARGQFLVYWQGGGGHSVVYEVENGKITIRDCQTNEKMSYHDWMVSNELYATGFEYLRTDNKDISKEALKGVRNRG